VPFIYLSDFVPDEPDVVLLAGAALDFESVPVELLDFASPDFVSPDLWPFLDSLVPCDGLDAWDDPLPPR
jgi:hypothetical protein